jgi:hypothetical protein
MTRFFMAGMAAVAIALVSGTGCQSTGVGDPCIPEQEYDPSFLGFAPAEVSVESKSFQCQSRLCLVNHFSGRVSCPYGQTSYNMGNGTAGPCQTPIGQAVTGTVDGMPISASDPPVDSVNKDKVLANCSSRQAANAVYCSCRCANVNGQTNDGANYCTCPDGFNCTQLVSSIGPADQGLTGAYCIKAGTAYDPNQVCAPCDPDSTPNCGASTSQNVPAR